MDGPSDDQTKLSDLRDGVALNVLSGLQAEVGLIGGQEGGWLFEAVFSKTPQQALNEALAAAIQEIGDPRCTQPSDLSAEQANLAIRRRAMRAQYESGVAEVGGSSASSDPAGKKQTPGPKASDEAMLVQVWLELIRQHAEGGLGGPVATPALSAREKDRRQKEPAERPWCDGGVLKELGKAEADLEVESQNMNLEVLRNQNRAIEEYVMRLVRRRDDLRQVTKLAEERDSYYILGLEGPTATEDEVKRAYRNLARREHPDKAGIGNHKRFQAIQQAYTAVLRQKKERGGSCGADADASSGERADGQNTKVFGQEVLESFELARQARDAADKVGICAHRALRSSEDAVEAQHMPKRRALRVLRDLTRQGSVELQGASEHLIVLGQAICGIAKCAEVAMAEHKEFTATTVTGIGIRDRAVIVEDAGRSALASAELLEKIGEATEATLKKVEKASPDVDSNGPPQRASGRGVGDEAAQLLRLGSRLLTESLSRTATIARRSADEAIGGAIKAFELSRSLVALDAEVAKEKERQNEKQKGFDEDVPMPAGDMDRPKGENEDAEEKGDQNEDTPASARTPNTARRDAAGGESSPRDQLKCAAKRVKERHVALRVKNLKFLSSLNEEALRMQARLWSLMERSAGALLPEITVSQKGRIFDLVAQLLDFALAECSRQAANPAAPAVRILERALAFALALEHTESIAMPADSRTQALRLAALIDSDLLCQIISGPFKRRLLAVGAKRKTADERTHSVGGYSQGYMSRRNSVRGDSHAAAQNGGAPPAKAWDESVHACCGRIVEGMRSTIAKGEASKAGNQPPT